MESQWKEFQLTKTATTTFSTKDLRNGKYKPLSMIAKDEGDDDEGWEAARKYAAKCIALGDQWVQWNSMTERAEFLHMGKGVEEVFDQSWHEDTIFKADVAKQAPKPARIASGEAAASQAVAVGAVGAAGGTGVADLAGGATTPIGTAGRGSKRTITTPAEVEMRKQRKKELDDGFKRINKIKSQVVVASQLARELIDLVDTHQEWSWARPMLDPLKRPVADLAELKASDNFSPLWLTSDEKDIKALIPAEESIYYLLLIIIYKLYNSFL